MPDLARISYYLVTALRRLHWDESRIKKHQDKKLRGIVEYAYANVPFYKELFDKAHVKPSDIRTAEDLNKLPVVRKGDLKKRPTSDFISNEFSVENLKRLKTGGSTGEPFSIYLNGKEDSWRKSIYMRANISCGQRPRDRWVAILDAERAVDTSALQHTVRIYAQKVIPVIWSRTRQLEAVEKSKPDVLDGFSNALWMLAREADLRNTKSIHPRIMFGSGELISQSSRQYLEKVFDAPFLDQFGCTEIDRSAWQCPEREGYHMDVDSVIMQFVDEKGEEVADGERGEIVYTSLFNRAMPFIRYGTRDIGIPISDKCSCGRKLPLMMVAEGRSNSFLIFPDGHSIAPMSFIETLKAFVLVKEIDQYRVLQKRTDLIEIYVKKTDQSVDEEHVRKWLLDNIRNDLPRVEKVDLSQVEFDVKFVDDLPVTPRGKLNVVTSYVQPTS